MILVVGEALIDMLPREVAGEPHLRPVPGGSPFNVAMALGRQEVPVRYLCRMSTDAFGELLSQTLADSGVDLAWCPRTALLSTLGFVSLDPQTKGARYAFYTENTAGCSLQTEDLPVPLPDQVTAIHIGSFSIAVEPFGATIETLIEQHAGKRCVSFDPNIRPFLIPDRDPFLARYQRLAARADLVKLSLEDLEWLYPGTPPEQVVEGLLAGGARLVVLTRGGEGALARTTRHQAETRLPDVEVVDTVGAGDTFQAALLAWLDSRKKLTRDGLDSLNPAELQSLLQFAAQAAAINCTRAGCNPPWRRELPMPS